MAESGGLYYETHGDPAAPTLLLSAGLGGSAGYWAPNIAALARRFHVVAYDHRGTGRSAREVPGDLTVEAMAIDVAGLIDALGIGPVTFVGHALGGMIGVALALARADAVARLVVVNGWGKLHPHTARCFDMRLALLRDSGARAYLHAQPLFLYPPKWLAAHHYELIEEEEQQLAHFPGAEMVQRRIGAARRFSAPPERLAAMRARTLVIATADDMLVPCTSAEALAAAIPDARLGRFASGGHACNVTRPDHFNTWLLAWLESA